VGVVVYAGSSFIQVNIVLFQELYNTDCSLSIINSDFIL
jgi:hypothetical protein